MKKKNKLTINTLAMGNLKQRKKQYTILIIGIILAMVFSSGIMFFVSTLLSSVEETKNRSFGKCESIYVGTQNIDFENDPISEYIGEYGLLHTVGGAYAEDKAGAFAVSYIGEGAEELYYPTLLEGRLPEKKGEIAVERSMLVKLGCSGSAVGDNISFNMLVPDGMVFTDKSEKKTYILTGILIDRRSNLDYYFDGDKYYPYIPGAIVSGEEETALGGKELSVAYFNYAESYNHKNEVQYDRYLKSKEPYNDTNAWEIPKRTYTDYGPMNTNDIEGDMYYAVAFSLILALISCLVIVNSFSNNLRERKKQIGMLRAVGATKRQIVRIFAREAFIISLISAPVSLVISYFGVRIALRIIGDYFYFTPKLWVLFCGALLGVLMVMGASLISLVSASRISPMQAIRNTEMNRKMKKRKIHSQKSFNVPSLLSKRNLFFFRFRQVVVSLLLTLTISLSCFGFSAVKHEMKQISVGDYEYTLYASVSFDDPFANLLDHNTGLTENDLSYLKSTGYFENIDAIKTCSANIMTEEFSDYMLLSLVAADMSSFAFELQDSGLTKDNYIKKITSEISPQYLDAKKRYGYDTEIYLSSLTGYTENMLETLDDSLIAGEIDFEKLSSGEEIILYVKEEIGTYLDPYYLEEGYAFLYTTGDPDYHEKQGIEIFDREKCPYKVGDEINLSVVFSEYADEKTGKFNFERFDKKVKIGALVRSLPDSSLFYGSVSSDLSVITNIDGYDRLTGNLSKYKSSGLRLEDEITEETDEAICYELEQLSLQGNGISYRSEYAFAQKNKEQIMTFIYAMLLVIILFFAICGSIINNALSARIREGKREIGTLRAVGADMSVLVKSYIKQLLSMFGWGFGFGFGIYTAGWLALYIAIKFFKVPMKVYSFSVFECLLMCAVLFGICAFNLYFKIKKEMKHSIVENIREL